MADDGQKHVDATSQPSHEANYDKLVALVRRSSKNLHEVNMRLTALFEEELEKSGDTKALAELRAYDAEHKA